MSGVWILLQSKASTLLWQTLLQLQHPALLCLIFLFLCIKPSKGNTAFNSKRQQWLKKKYFASSRLNNVFRDEYHTLCFIWSLLSHVVIKLRHFSFPREWESFSLMPQHTLARLPLLYHIGLSQPPPHLSQSNQHLYKHHQPQASALRKDTSVSPLLHLPCSYGVTEGVKEFTSPSGVCLINTTSVINRKFTTGAVVL